MKKLRLILGDQLNPNHSWFKEQDKEVIYALFEMRQETDYVKHHIQKVIGFFAAMRSFHQKLEDEGHRVVYYRINDSENTQSLADNIQKLIGEYDVEKFEYLMPDEYRLDQQLKEICEDLDMETESFDTEHFYTERTELTDFFEGKKQYLMENFYRHMRKTHEVLMDGDQPEGGEWNYDQSNRKKWKGEPSIPEELTFENDVSQIADDIEKAAIDTIGRWEGNNFPFPVNQEQAMKQIDYFCKHLLVHFGDFQDALHTEEEYLFHSRLSFALNTKMIAPKQVVDKVLDYYYDHRDEIDISQVEGFVRQILGWREYMRGIYWKEMPEYAQLNELDNRQSLPDFFWTGDTQMNCLSNAINNSLDNAYAHHIQRLMITGNFALLAQVDPDEVDQWYLGIYIDAIQWVEITNTRGMSQFADGGIIATKPYVSSANYINKMGNYCSSCHYNKNERTGEDACPFNSLYWYFLEDKKEHLKGNSRMGMMYSLLSKIDDTEMEEIRSRAQKIMSNPDQF